MVKKRRILIFSELRPDAKNTAWAGGYSVIVEGLGLGLHKLGHEIKVLALSYQGEKQPHNLPFSVIPLLSTEYVGLQLDDIIRGWWPDALIVAFDLPHHADIHAAIRGRVRYIGIFPVEGEPIVPEWADAAADFDAGFCISEFGVRAMAKAGVRVKLLPVAPTIGFGRADPDVLHDLKSKALLDGKFVILKVADNHSRKNWAHTVEFWARWGKPDCVLNAVTRPENAYGWHFPALLEEFGGKRLHGTERWIWPDGKEVRVLRELVRNDLAWVFNFSRERGCLLMDTGGEGLGMPILEAFLIGIPVVGLRHTAIGDLLADGRGVLVEPDYEFRDVFGNCKRYHPGYQSWADGMDQIYYHPELAEGHVQKATRWIANRQWLDAARLIEASL